MKIQTEEGGDGDGRVETYYTITSIPLWISWGVFMLIFTPIKVGVGEGTYMILVIQIFILYVNFKKYFLPEKVMLHAYTTIL